jgi:hypothetical protein
MTSTTSKVVIILESSRDWEDWYETVLVKAQTKGVLSFCDLTVATKPALLDRPKRPAYSDIKAAAITYADLEDTEKDFYKVLVTDYQMLLKEYEKQQAGVVEIVQFIRETSNRRFHSYIKGLRHPYELLQALQKRLAPNDRARRVDLAKDYQALKKPPTTTGVEKWLQQWETTYAEAERLNLPEILDHRALFDFLMAARSLDSTYVGAYHVACEEKLETDPATTPSLYDAVEKVRNYLRLAKSLSKSTASHTAFSSFQGEIPNELEAETTSAELTASKSDKSCLCGEHHRYSACPYLVKQSRPTNWTPNEKIQKEIDEKLANSQTLREIVHRARQWVNKQSKKQQKKSLTALKELPTEQLTRPSSPLPQTSFAVTDSSSFSLRDTWILDSGANSHVCNDRSRFIFERAASEDDTLISGRTVYSIEAYGSVVITVQTHNGPRQITLLNVSLIPGFFTNIASLNRFTSKGVHWDTQKQRLHINGKPFCKVLRADNHWALESNPLSPAATSATVFASSTAPRRDREASADHWHAIMGHAGREPISHLQQSTIGAVVTTPQSTSVCETCSVSKAREIISRRPTKEDPAEEPLARVAYDLIPMTVAYNDEVWVSHFRDYFTCMDFVYTHKKKSQAVDIIRAFFNMAQARYKRTIRYLRTDGERSLGSEFDELVAVKGITTERSAPATQAQNGAAERSGGVLIIKARCMRIAARLPKSMWPEIVKAAGYLNNRTPKRQLNWRTPYEALNDKKPDLSHLHVYGCRAYPLDKGLPKSRKLLPRAHIGYFVGYDSTNVYRIWVPSRERVIRTRDVTFDEELFYEHGELDLGHLLKERAEQVVEILDLSTDADAEAGPVVSDDEETFDLLDLTPPSVDSSADSTALKSALSGQLPTPKLTPDPPAPPAASESSPPGPLSADFDARNIIPEGTARSRTRRQKYAAALLQTTDLTAFHTSFAHGLSVGGAKSEGQHRDTLPAEPQN